MFCFVLVFVCLFCACFLVFCLSIPLPYFYFLGVGEVTPPFSEKMQKNLTRWYDLWYDGGKWGSWCILDLLVFLRVVAEGGSRYVWQMGKTVYLNNRCFGDVLWMISARLVNLSLCGV